MSDLHSPVHTSALSIPPPPAPARKRALAGRIWAIFGVTFGFIALIVPGVFALRSYHRWQAGTKERPTVAWICAWSGMAILGLGLIGAWLTYGRPLFKDDFSDPGSGWRHEVVRHASTGYVDGEYAITLNGRSEWGSGLVWDEGRLPNVSVEVDARLVEGSERDTSLGIGCWDHEADEGYLFTVSDSAYAILWSGSADAIELASGPIVGADITRMQRIRGICRSGFGPASFTLELDGKLVARVTQPRGARVRSFSAMLLNVETDDNSPVEARFDDALARAVTPS